jgi:hypothetical protein
MNRLKWSIVDSEPRASGPECSDENRLVADTVRRLNPDGLLAAYKPARENAARRLRSRFGLKPYWGKSAVRNFRGGEGNVMHGLAAICHAARKGGHIGSRWPTHRRAFSPLGSSWFRRVPVRSRGDAFENRRRVCEAAECCFWLGRGIARRNRKRTGGVCGVLGERTGQH